jgi:hypothetical protein
MISKWDQRYGATEYFYGTSPNDFLREHACRVPAAGEVLCLGEGEGRNAVYLAACGLRVTALDQSAVGLAKAERLAVERGVQIGTRVADLADYAIAPAAWDAIVSIWCHLPGALRVRVHRTVVAGLRPGGILLLEAYTPDQLRHRTGGPTDPDLMPTLDALRLELRGLEFLYAAERERRVEEGVGHAGLSAVVQLAARKPAAG